MSEISGARDRDESGHDDGQDGWPTTNCITCGCRFDVCVDEASGLQASDNCENCQVTRSTQIIDGLTKKRARSFDGSQVFIRAEIELLRDFIASELKGLKKGTVLSVHQLITDRWSGFHDAIVRYESVGRVLDRVLLLLSDEMLADIPEVEQVADESDDESDDDSTDTYAGESDDIDVSDAPRDPSSTSGPSTSTPPQTQAEPIQEPTEPDVPEKWTVKRGSSGFIVGGPYQNVAIPDHSQPQTPKKTYSSLFQVDLPQPQPQSPPGNPPGLTLRDYFAAAALSSSNICNDLRNDRHAVTAAWSVADMMMAQRSRESEYTKWMQMVIGRADQETLEGLWEGMFVWDGRSGEVGTETVGDIWEKYSWDWKEQVKGEHQRILDEM